MGYRATGQFPIVTRAGPRQADKTALTRPALPEHDDISLKALEKRRPAHVDPGGFSAGLLMPVSSLTKFSMCRN